MMPSVMTGLSYKMVAGSSKLLYLQIMADFSAVEVTILPGMRWCDQKKNNKTTNKHLSTSGL